jgi:hypothetical protein
MVVMGERRGSYGCYGREERFIWLCERRGLYRVLWENLREMGPLEDTGVDRRVILKWMFKNLDVAWVDLAQDTYGIRR